MSKAKPELTAVPAALWALGVEGPRGEGGWGLQGSGGEGGQVVWGVVLRISRV